MITCLVSSIVNRFAKHFEIYAFDKPNCNMLSFFIRRPRSLQRLNNLLYCILDTVEEADRELSEEQILEVIESAYPNPITTQDIAK